MHNFKIFAPFFDFERLCSIGVTWFCSTSTIKQKLKKILKFEIEALAGFLFRKNRGKQNLRLFCTFEVEFIRSAAAAATTDTRTTTREAVNDRGHR